MMTQLTSLDHELQTSDLQILSLKQKLRLNDFENKQRLIQMQCQVQVYKTRAEEYKSRYETLLQNNGDQQVSKLLQKLKDKENQILQIRAKEIESKSRLATRYKQMQFKSNQKLEGQLNELMLENKQLNQKIEDIKSRAVQALVEKQNIINNLTKKKDSEKENQRIEQSFEYLELKDQYQRQTQKYEIQIKDYQLQLNQSKIQYKELMDRLEKNAANYDEKLIKLECDLEEKMHANITQVFNTYQANQNSLLQDLEQLQSTLQKLQLKNNQLEIQNQKLKHQTQTDKEKLTSQIQSLIANHSQEISKLEKNYEKALKTKTKEVDELNRTNEKLKYDFRRIVEEQVDQLREGSESNKKKSRNGLGNIRKLSQQETKDAHREITQSFNGRINQYDNKSEKERIRLNQLKQFEQNYEWLGEHEGIRVTDFDEDTRQINNQLKQSIQSIQILQPNSYYNTTLQKSELSDRQVLRTTKTQKEEDTIKQSRARSKQYHDQADQISKLKINFEQSEQTISDLNKTIGILTKQIQDNRQVIQQLKKQKQKSSSENPREIELRNEMESMKTYLCELEVDKMFIQKELLSQKWKYTELMDYLRSEIELREIEYQKQVVKATNKKKSLRS